MPCAVRATCQSHASDRLASTTVVYVTCFVYNMRVDRQLTGACVGGADDVNVEHINSNCSFTGIDVAFQTLF